MHEIVASAYQTRQHLGIQKAPFSISQELKPDVRFHFLLMQHQCDLWLLSMFDSKSFTSASLLTRIFSLLTRPHTKYMTLREEVNMQAAKTWRIDFISLSLAQAAYLSLPIPLIVPMLMILKRLSGRDLGTAGCMFLAIYMRPMVPVSRMGLMEKSCK